MRIAALLLAWTELPAAAASVALSSDEVLLVQHSVIPRGREDGAARESVDLHRQSLENWPLPPSWSTGPYADCSDTCGIPVSTRPVECRSFVDGSVLPHDLCYADAKPSMHKPCSCDLVLCNKTRLDCAEVAKKETPLERDGYEMLGCFKLHEDDAFDPEEACDNSTVFDETCVNWTRDDLCRSGFPFYRNCKATTPSSCSAFCWSKGLDLSTVVYGKECRCGASRLNVQAWHGERPRRTMLFDIEQLRPEPELKRCDLLVNRYNGYYQSRGIPEELLRLTLDDEAYHDGLIHAEILSPDSMEEGKEPAKEKEELQEPPTLAMNGNGRARKGKSRGRGDEPPWMQPCWPDNCGPGRGAWSERSPNRPFGITTQFDEYVFVRYAFRPEVDNTRKEAFKRACEAWYTTTCLVLKEVAPGSVANNEYIDVGIESEDNCRVSGAGKGYIFFNQGSCSDLTHVGNIIHELGHALGMDNEQERPDAQVEFFGKGPYLTNFGGYTDPKAYTGSKWDGERDPHVGYADYDFDSIMHAPPDHFNTIPGSAKSRTGQRVAPSAGDVAQILDMYQCRQQEPMALLDVRGTAPGCENVEGFYSLMQTSSDAAHHFYKAVEGSMWMHWTPECNWVIDDAAPNPHLTEDEENKKPCEEHVARYPSDNPVKANPPMGTVDWLASCSGSDGKIAVTITIATSTTTSTTTTTTVTTSTTTVTTVTTMTTTTVTTTTVTTITTTTTTESITTTTSTTTSTTTRSRMWWEFTQTRTTTTYTAPPLPTLPPPPTPLQMLKALPAPLVLLALFLTAICYRV